MTSGFIGARFVVVLGKVGCGKSTLINKVLGEDIMPAKRSVYRVTDKITQTIGKKEFYDGKMYELNFIDTIGMGDHVEFCEEARFSNPEIIIKIKTALNERFRQGVSLIIVTLRYKSFRKDDKDMFKLLKSHFLPLFWESAVLVITHCEGINDSELKAHIEELRAAEPEILKFDDRIVTVGFPDLDSLKVEVLKQQYKEDMKKDVTKLQDHIIKAAGVHPCNNIIHERKFCNIS